MSTLKLYQTEMIAHDGTPVRLVYDQEADILEIFFGENGNMLIEPIQEGSNSGNILVRLTVVSFFVVLGRFPSISDVF